MNNIILNIKKYILPISILVGCIILGRFIYSGITEKQYAISEQEKKEYIGKRKMECYEIFEKERSKQQEQHNSVTGVQYYEPSKRTDTYSDTCRVEYKYMVKNANNQTEIVTEYVNY